MTNNTQGKCFLVEGTEEAKELFRNKNNIAVIRIDEGFKTVKTRPQLREASRNSYNKTCYLVIEHQGTPQERCILRLQDTKQLKNVMKNMVGTLPVTLSLVANERSNERSNAIPKPTKSRKITKKRRIVKKRKITKMRRTPNFKTQFNQMRIQVEGLKTTMNTHHEINDAKIKGVAYKNDKSNKIILGMLGQHNNILGQHSNIIGQTRCEITVLQENHKQCMNSLEEGAIVIQGMGQMLEELLNENSTPPANCRMSAGSLFNNINFQK
jgi:hypothetical protein